MSEYGLTMIVSSDDTPKHGMTFNFSPVIPAQAGIHVPMMPVTRIEHSLTSDIYVQNQVPLLLQQKLFFQVLALSL